MVQVPYQPFATATPESPGERVTVSTPPAAFGENVAAAVQQLGTTVEHVGDEVFSRALALQDLRNETDAREAASNYSVAVAKVQADYDALEGKAKRDALDSHIQDLKNLRQQYRGSLTTPNAQRMYDADTFNFMNRNVFSSAGQAGDANKRYIEGTARNSLDLTDTSWADPSSEAEFQEKWQQKKRALETINGIRNDGMDQAREQEAYSKLKASQIDALSRTDAQAASRMLDGLPKGTLREEEYQRTLEHVQSQNHSVGSRVIADKVMAPVIHGPATAQRPDRPLQEYLDEGDRIAQQQAPNDPAMRDYVRARITTLYNGHNNAVSSFKYQNINTINDGILGQEGGQRPTSIEELNALGPKYQQAWNNLDATSKQTVLDKLSRMTKVSNQWTVEGVREIQRLRGMAIDDPAAFLDLDPTKQKVPIQGMREIGNLQRQIQQGAERDPRTTRSMTQLGNLIPQAVRDDKESRQQYMGALEDQLRDFQDQNKRPPKYEELKEINARLLQEQVTQKGWFGTHIGETKGPMYNLPIPQSDIDDMKQKLKAKNGLDYSDTQIRREIIRQQLEQFHPPTRKSTNTFAPGEEVMPE